MDIAGINRITQTAPEATGPGEPGNHGPAREVAQAVRTLNTAHAFGPHNELLFQIDDRTQKIVIQVVDRETHEIVSQIPAEYVLRMAEDLKSSPPK